MRILCKEVVVFASARKAQLLADVATETGVDVASVRAALVEEAKQERLLAAAAALDVEAAVVFGEESRRLFRCIELTRLVLRANALSPLDCVLELVKGDVGMSNGRAVIVFLPVGVCAAASCCFLALVSRALFIKDCGVRRGVVFIGGLGLVGVFGALPTSGVSSGTVITLEALLELTLITELV